MRSVSATTGLFAACLATPSLARTLTVKNSCGVTIFPAYAGKSGHLSQEGKVAPGGWELEAGGETVLDIPDVWRDGRIWIRSGGEGCTANVKKCLIGKCDSSGGGLECDGEEYGQLGKTLAEFTFDPSVSEGDFYDISMVEGFTVGMQVIPSDSSCTTGSCGVDGDLLKSCDSRLIWPKGSDHFWGCANPCMAGVQFSSLYPGAFDPGTSPSCCLGQWADDKCPHAVIPFYDDLKKLCKNGYVYAKDDLPFNSTQSAVWNCKSDTSSSGRYVIHMAAASPADKYTVDICPGGINTGLTSAPSTSQSRSMNPGSHGALNVQGSGGDDPSDETTPSSVSRQGSGPSSSVQPSSSFISPSSSNLSSTVVSSTSVSLSNEVSVTQPTHQPSASISHTKSISVSFTAGGDHHHNGGHWGIPDESSRESGMRWAGGVEQTKSACARDKRKRRRIAVPTA